MTQPIQVLCLSPVLPVYEQALVAPDLTCLHCATADDFKTILKNGAIDLILSDFSLPELGLPEILARLKDENLDLPVVAVLEKISRENIADLILAGAADCVSADQTAHLKAVIHREIKNLRSKEDLRKQRLEDVRAVSARLAHDFNNILAPIAMSAPMLKWEIDDTEYDDLIETMEQSALGGAEMIRDLQIFGRGTNLLRSQISLGDLLEEAVEDFRKTAAPDIRLELGLEEDLPILSADPEKLKHVMTHLLNNASETMPDGGMIKIRAGKEYGGNDLWFSIRDHGEGIDPKVLPQIFDPFFSTKRHLKKGAGLGLSLALGIVKSHGGSITVSSRKGKGSRFRVTLPLKKPPVEKNP